MNPVIFVYPVRTPSRLVTQRFMKVSIDHQKEDPQAFTTSDVKQKKHASVRLSETLERAEVSSPRTNVARYVRFEFFALVLATLEHRSAPFIRAILTSAIHLSTVSLPYYHFVRIVSASPKLPFHFQPLISGPRSS